jgi:hypothetical protein
MVGAAAIPVAVARYFMRGWVEPFGIPTVFGSLLASVSVVLLAGMLILFSQEARAPEGRYLLAAKWYTLLALWCEVLVIACILLSGRLDAPTYYEGPWDSVRHAFPTAERHALAHVSGLLPKLAVGLALGAVVYAIEKRHRGR